MNKPNWRPYVHPIDGWGLRAESAAYRVCLREGLSGEWEWRISEIAGEHVQDGRSSSIINAINGAERAWEANQCVF